MEAYRTAILKKEFPFIVELVNLLRLKPTAVDSIQIKRGNGVLLGKKGSENSYDWSGGGHYDYTRYFAIWNEGEERRIIEEFASAGESGDGSGGNNSWDADTIGEQLFDSKIVPDYIVECTQDDTDNNGNGRVLISWTIFKMNRFDLSAYHQAQIDQAAAILKAEIAAACME